MAKFITAKQAAELIPDGSTVGIAGMGLSGWPEEVACAIRDRFKECGHPRGITLHQGSAMGDHGYLYAYHTEDAGGGGGENGEFYEDGAAIRTISDFCTNFHWSTIMGQADNTKSQEILSERPDFLRFCHNAINRLFFKGIVSQRLYARSVHFRKSMCYCLI